MESTAYDPQGSRQRLAEANEALGRGDVPAALAALQLALEMDPRNDEVPLLAAALQLKNGDPIRAAHLATDALSIRPFNPRALDVLAVACIDALQPALAQKILRLAQAAAPGAENLKKNLEDARRKTRALKRADVPKSEILRSAHLLPQKKITSLLKAGEPRLSVAVVIRDGDEPAATATVEAVRETASQVVVVDARADASEWRPTEENVAVIRAEDEERGALEAWQLALKSSDGDWVFWLEAGQIPEDGWQQQIESAMNADGALGHVVTVALPGGAARSELRLVRNAAGISFAGRRRPRLASSCAALESSWGLTVESGEMRLAWAVEPALSDRQPQDLAHQIDKDIAADPDDHAARVDRAWLLLEAGDAARALELVAPAVRALSADTGRNRPLDLEEPVTLEAACLMHLDRTEELIEKIEAYQREHPATANTCLVRGVAEAALGRPELGAELFEAALSHAAQPMFSPLLPQVEGPALPNLLGAMLMERGELERARSAFRHALRRVPDNVEARLGLVALQLADGQIREVLEELDEMVAEHGDDPKVWVAGGVVLSHTPTLRNAAAEWLAEAHRRFPDDADIDRRLADAQLRCGRAADALASWDRTGDESAATRHGRLAAALATGGELPALTGPELDSAAEPLLACFHAWLESEAYEALDAALVRLREQADQVPELATRTAAWLERVGQAEAAARLRGTPAEQPAETAECRR